MLRRPFEVESPNSPISELFDKIKFGEIYPLREDISEDVKNLLRAMLQKDPNKRPDIAEVSYTPFIFKAIERYHREVAPDDSFI